MTDSQDSSPVEVGIYNPGGDMTQGVARAHIETPEEIAADPIEDNETVTPSYSKQHAKVLRFEISVGKDDDEHTIEEFENMVRNSLFAGTKSTPLRYNTLTVMGGYYIIDGQVCLAQDYDPATKNRKPGTFPPVWAGGPAKGKEHEYEQAHHTPPRREEVVQDDSAEDVVAKLAGNMNREVKQGD